MTLMDLWTCDKIQGLLKGILEICLLTSLDGFLSDKLQNFCNVPIVLPLLLKIWGFSFLIGHLEILALMIYWICGSLQLRTVLFLLSAFCEYCFWHSSKVNSCFMCPLKHIVGWPDSTQDSEAGSVIASERIVRDVEEVNENILFEMPNGNLVLPLDFYSSFLCYSLGLSRYIVV